MEQIVAELEGLGYAPVVESHPNYRQVVVVEYLVENGRFVGKKFRLGISMHGSEGYPEYPPHFIHLSPPPDAPRDGAPHGSPYSCPDAEGVEHQWIALSRPPNEFWDRLPTKNMQGYMEHLRRFWRNV